MTRYRLGVNTCFAVKRWPLAEQWAKIVRDDLGIDLVQHSLDLVDLDAWTAQQAAEVTEACAAFGLRLESTFTGLAAYSSNLLLHPRPAARLAAEVWYRKAIAFTAAVGAQATGGHVGAYAVADFDNPTRRATLHHELKAALARLASYARTLGVSTLYIENLAVAREPSTTTDIEGLLSAPSPERAAIELCLDVGHQCVDRTGGAERDPYAWLRRFAGSCSMIQLQQSDADADHHWPFTPPTNRIGRIDAERVLAALSAPADRVIDLVLEVIPPFEQPDREVLADMVASADYWRDALNAVASPA